MNPVIRPCSATDLAVLQKIGYETFDETFGSMIGRETMDAYLQEAFSTEKLSEELGNKDCRFYFLYLGEELAGYLKLNDGPAQSDIHGPQSVEVERIYVRRSHQGQGLGRLLMDFAFRQARERRRHYVWLGVWERNAAAIASYRQLGFRATGRHSFRMREEPQSDLIMKRIVTDT